MEQLWSKVTSILVWDFFLLGLVEEMDRTAEMLSGAVSRAVSEVVVVAAAAVVEVAVMSLWLLECLMAEGQTMSCWTYYC